MSEELLKHLDNIKKNKNLCQNLSFNYEKAIELEKIQVSEFSPAIVSHSEEVARLIFSPFHVEPDGNTIKPTAFDDVSNKGLSTNRCDYCSKEQIHTEGEQKAIQDKLRTKQEKGYEGFTVANVGDIRNLLDKELQIFAVYDTSLSSNISHSDVCLILHKGDGNTSEKTAKRKRRKELQRIFGQLLKSS